MRLTSAITLGELDAEAVTVEIVVVAATNGILSIPIVIKCNESKSRWTSRCLQINLSDLSVPVRNTEKVHK